MKKIKNFISLLLSVVLLSSIAAVALADGTDTKTFQVNSSSDLKKLSSLCRLDTSSVNLVVNLNADIAVNSEFTPIPIFSGTFNGNGHKITGVKVTEKYSYSGLFGIVTESAVIRNLTVSAEISPSGEMTSIGGIAGVNYGTIESCAFYGSVKGKDTIGGIAGNNAGTIKNCNNYATINVGHKDGKLQIKDIKELTLQDLANLKSVKASDDVGGIAGGNTGYIYSCNNYGSVGTSGNGYCVGGIVGNNSGYITMCSNCASVVGNSKVGGIAGQTTPYIKTEYSKDVLSPITDDVDAILDILEDITYQVDDDTDIVTNSITQITNTIASASGHANMIQTSVYTFANDTIGEVNHILTYADTAMNGLENVSKDITGVTDDIHEGIEYVGEAVTVIKDGGSVVDAMPIISEAISSFGDAVTDVSYAADDLNKMLSNMNDVSFGQFSQISPEVKNSIALLTNDVKKLSSEIQQLSNNLNGAEKMMTEDVRGMSYSIRDLITDATDIVYSLQDITVGDVIKDTSGDAVKNTDKKLGIIENCLNTGSVTAKEHAGGIVGKMGIVTSINIDNSGEPEAYTVKTLSYRSIISYSRNYGYITTQGDYCGSICGQESVGAIVYCQGYGYIESEKGKCVGGIAGASSGLIRDCFAKTILSGDDYVAGIVGEGTAGGLLSGGSTVSECVADATVVSDSQHKGGISGAEKGTFTQNYFLVGELNGIEAYSREAQAAPVNKQTLLSFEGCPNEFSWSEQQLLSTATREKTSQKDTITAASISAGIIAAIGSLVAVVTGKSKKKEETEQIVGTQTESTEIQPEKTENAQSWKD